MPAIAGYAVQHTLWSHSAIDRPRPDVLRGDTTCDVAIVGAGFTGLTAAVRLAEAGKRVIVLDADVLGAGASGVNAGFVVPNFAKADPDAVLAKLGDERGNRLLLAVGSSADDLFDLIRSKSIDCDAEQTGWLHVAHDDASAELLRARARSWQALGRPIQYLDEQGARARTAARHCRGGLFDPSGGMLNPLGLVYGLARLARGAGVVIKERAAVSSATRADNGWVLDVGGHSVRAQTVLLCTNGSTLGLARLLGRLVVPLRVYQIATAPLPSSVAERIAPFRNPLADTRANLFTCRLDRDNRLISGGMAVLPIGAERRMALSISRRLARELGLASAPEVEFVWRGTAAVTRDFLPHIYRLGEDFFGAIGCNGRGIAVTSVVGRALADKVLQGFGCATPIPDMEPRVSFGLVAAIAPSLVVAQGLWKDRRSR